MQQTSSHPSDLQVSETSGSSNQQRNPPAASEQEDFCLNLFTLDEETGRIHHLPLLGDLRRPMLIIRIMAGPDTGVTVIYSPPDRPRPPGTTTTNGAPTDPGDLRRCIQPSCCNEGEEETCGGGRRSEGVGGRDSGGILEE